MEKMRLQTYFLVNVQLDSKHSLSNAKQLMKFKWDEEDYDEDKVVVPDWNAIEEKYKGIA